MLRLRPFSAVPRRAFVLLASLGPSHAWVQGCSRSLHALTFLVLPAVFLSRTAREQVYNVLWVVVFAFATLNILTLGARHFEADRRGLSFGEVIAIMVVLLSVVMLGWELLYMFHILPLRLTPR